jgi:hypothetical protein
MEYGRPIAAIRLKAEISYGDLILSLQTVAVVVLAVTFAHAEDFKRNISGFSLGIDPATLRQEAKFCQDVPGCEPPQQYQSIGRSGRSASSERDTTAEIADAIEQAGYA